ncbi:hypothetical protein [Polycladidibacter stylochi]|uniref:hypothetical protein n=1 Tax=Polycladidibacter stylochi TaxID=1807766 RepID=UPI000830E0F2|nr:hypothetical protein [Pseudovibrio stylochi]
MDRRAFLGTSMGALACSAVPLFTTPVFARSNAVRLRDLYNKDMSFTPYANKMNGQAVAIEGFMAPPLKADAMFFVLTTRPMSVCPFCETEAEWPDDILVVYTKRPIEVVSFNVPIVVEGLLEIGSFEDYETGFLSRVRLRGASYFEV